MATTQAEPKVTRIDGSWNPCEGGAVTTRPNPLHRPVGVDFDSQGRMWIVELEGGRVHRLANGVRAHVSGVGSKSYRGDGGPLGQATFNGMHNLAIGPDDSVYIADSWNHCIRKINADGRITTIAGTGKPRFSGDSGQAAKGGVQLHHVHHVESERGQAAHCRPEKQAHPRDGFEFRHRQNHCRER
ncbi:MAG TPA: hypothetical protein DGJ56_08050 [Verrucomicrobiales bacterium]|nr:hypothetical protein [Verrucomicrobiales bacterium]